MIRCKTFFIKARWLWCCKFKMPWKRRNRCEPCVALSCLAGVAEKILSKQKQEESWNSPLRKNISRIPKHFPIIWEAERARARSGWMQDLSSWLKLHRKSLILPRRRSPAVQWQTYSWIQAFWVRTSIYRNVIAQSKLFGPFHSFWLLRISRWCCVMMIFGFWW